MINPSLSQLSAVWIHPFTLRSNRKLRNYRTSSKSKRLRGTKSTKPMISEIRDSISGMNNLPSESGVSKIKFVAGRINGRQPGPIDVGDGCWRQNALVITLRCW